MAYATIENVQGLVPSLRISDSSKPTITQVKSFIDNSDGEINSALGVRGLTIPITSPTWFLEEMESLSAMGAAARSWMVAFPAESGPNSSSLGATLWRTYQARLLEIRKGIGIPQVAVSESEVTFPRDFFTDHDADWTDGEIEDPSGNLIYSGPTVRMSQVW